MPYGLSRPYTKCLRLGNNRVDNVVEENPLPRRASIVRVQPPDVSLPNDRLSPRFRTWGGPAPASADRSPARCHHGYTHASKSREPQRALRKLV